MAKITTPTNTLSSPAWASETLSPDRLIPGGAVAKLADFTAEADGKKKIAAGTLLGRTLVERDAGNGLGPWTLADVEVYIAAADNGDLVSDPGITLYRNAHGVFENWLPGWGSYSADAKAAVRLAYQCTIGGEVS